MAPLTPVCSLGSNFSLLVVIESVHGLIEGIEVHGLLFHCCCAGRGQHHSASRCHACQAQLSRYVGSTPNEIRVPFEVPNALMCECDMIHLRVGPQISGLHLGL